jgi:HEAT repeat protein
MKNIGTQLAAVAVAFVTMATPALAGKGGSNADIQAAVSSGSVDSIIAAVERAESLSCEACVDTVLALTQDNRYKVREVAAWWFARRTSAGTLAQQFVGELQSSDSTQVRNAADFLGAATRYEALPALAAAYARGGLNVDARYAIVRAVGVLAHASGNAILAAGMKDADASVRALAVTAWRDVRGQTNAAPVEPLLGDSDAGVRAAAATVLGAYKDATVLGALEQLVVGDASPQVRRNAAWALGQIGSADATAALTQAAQDKSGLVRGVAKASLARLH